ncbi:MAG TPA: DnaB-like helicase C-terminal domain-containing protein [Candidatus Paceibacterota bacterium]
MKTKPADIIYSPLDVSSLGQEYLAWKRDHKEFGLPFFSKKMRDKVYPLFPGEVLSIIARPGHAKTSVMMLWARQRARWLKENRQEKRAVIYATWEQSIEELHSFYLAAEQGISITKMAKGDLHEEDWKKVEQGTADRVNEPLWFVGHSMVRRSGRKPITVETLAQAIEKIQNFGDGFDVDSVYVDYLQRIHPVGGFENPVMAYTQIMTDLKNFALGFGVPMVVGVQASREVEELKVQIPEMHHAQWTSNIEQTSDRVLSLVRPRRYRKEGEMFGSHKVEGQSQLLVNVVKQKLGEANFAEWLKFNPIYNKLDDNELFYGGV